MTKINSYWNNIFEKYKILDQIDKDGKFEISASQINEFKEARLMTKFDNASQLPRIFTENELSILPITRGNYVIAPMDIFHKFPMIESSNEISYFNFPDNIQTLLPDNINSESLALNAVYISEILEDFIQDEKLLPTINGRMSSSLFNFNIKNTKTEKILNINVNNAQIEIDAGYEGVESFSIIEAKSHFADDFVIRQLYYPMRLWSSRVRKNIKTIFMVHTNGIYYLYDFKFNDLNNYNSLTLNKFKRYSFDKLEINIEDIEKIVSNTHLVNEPQIPFPQADSFERIINLCELLNQRELTKDDVTMEYGFDKRQTDYYLNACKYLDLVEERDSKFLLSSTARRIMQQSPTTKQLAFAKQILSHPVFSEVLKKQLETGKVVSRQQIIDIMKKYPLFNVKTYNTFYRRSSTVSSWIDWITSLTSNTTV